VCSYRDGKSRRGGHSQSHNGRQSIRLFALIRAISQKISQKVTKETKEKPEKSVINQWVFFSVAWAFRVPFVSFVTFCGCSFSSVIGPFSRSARSVRTMIGRPDRD
jgi:hypothetical protein